MLATLSALSLHAALAVAQLDVKVEGNLQVRGGYSYTPYTQGPDSAPLLNVPLLTQPQWLWNLIVAPGVTGKVKLRGVKLELQYSPRAFLDLQNLRNKPQVFHRMHVYATAGKAQDWLLNGGVQLTLGGLDLGQAGQLAGEFSGTLRPGANTPAASFINTNAFARAEHPIGRGLRYVVNLTGTKIVSPGSGGLAGINAVPQAGTGGGLTGISSQQRLELRNEVDYRLNGTHSFSTAFGLSLVSFPATDTYLGLTPLAGWQATLSSLTKLTAHVGALLYWTNPYPGRWEGARGLAVADVAVDHTFTDLGLPKLSGHLSFAEAPYYDLVFAVLEPRATFIARVDYKFTRKLDLQLQLRDYTQAYFDASGFVPIPPGHTRNVGIISAQLTFNQAKWLQYQAGAYGLDRRVEPSGTVASTELRDYYFFVGIKGSWDAK